MPELFHYRFASCNRFGKQPKRYQPRFEKQTVSTMNTDPLGDALGPSSIAAPTPIGLVKGSKCAGSGCLVRVSTERGQVILRSPQHTSLLNYPGLRVGGFSRDANSHPATVAGLLGAEFKYPRPLPAADVHVRTDAAGFS